MTTEAQRHGEADTEKTSIKMLILKKQEVILLFMGKTQFSDLSCSSL
jgi:hypothetical protein